MDSLNDEAGGANLYGGTNYSFTYDRFCKPYSAIYFNSGYLLAPPGVYFWGDFTLTAWINVKVNLDYVGILDFGNSSTNNHIVWSILNSEVRAGVIINQSLSVSISSTPIKLNTWYHVAYVVSGTTGYIYVNGIEKASGQLVAPVNVQRSLNYIGKSNINATYDELKLYKIALSATEILNDYTASSPNNGIFIFFVLINKNYLIYFKVKLEMKEYCPIIAQVKIQVI